MKRVVLLVCLLAPVGWADVVASPTVDDKKIEELMNHIDRSSEKGDLAGVHDFRLSLAEYAASIGRYDLAARQYDLLLATRPRRKERVRLFTEQGKMRMALGDYSRAIGSFDDALHDSPNDWEANLERARAFFASDLNQRAIESYLKCVKLRPRESAPYYELAQVYERQGFNGKALSYYQQALAREPKPEIYLHMSDCYLHSQNITQAIVILTQAKARLPLAEYDVRLGEIYQRLGDLPHAGAAWEGAIKADRKRDDVRMKLTLIYDQLNRRADTDRLFKQLLADYPQSPLVHYFHALVLLERGEKSASLEEARKVESLSPTEAVSHYNELLLERLRKPS